jgi:tetratricopeptide (TPR) repeat protein
LYAAKNLRSLAVASSELGNIDVAEEYLEQAFVIQAAEIPNSMDMGETLVNLAGISWRRGDLEKSERYGRQALSIIERMSPMSLAAGYLLDQVGLTQQSRGNLAGAQADYRRALLIFKRMDPQNIAVATTYLNLGCLELEAGTSTKHKLITSKLCAEFTDLQEMRLSPMPLVTSASSICASAISQRPKLSSDSLSQCTSDSACEMMTLSTICFI